jgi:hypothetical protein
MDGVTRLFEPQWEAVGMAILPLVLGFLLCYVAPRKDRLWRLYDRLLDRAPGRRRGEKNK